MDIINGNIITLEEKNYNNGYIKIKDGIITEIGFMSDYKPSGDDSIDAQGMFVFPGLVDAHCHIGMWEDGIDFEGDDGNEDTDPITPHLRAIDAINPMDITFKEAYKSGVTTVVTGPGSANPIAGQFCAMKTFGNRIDDMIISPYVAMKMALGENPKCTYHDKNQTPVTRMATAALIREALFKAKQYDEDLQKYIDDPEENDKPEFDMKCESLLPVLHKEVPVKFHAHRADDIFTAIRIAKEFNLWLTIEHCTEGHLIADYLKNEDVSVAVGPLICDRSKPELKNQQAKNPAVLCETGINVAIITDHPELPINYLSLSAMVAIKEGMSQLNALKAITINAARHCGIDNRVGSIKEGKDADIIICDDNLVTSPFAKVNYCIISGEIASR